MQSTISALFNNFIIRASMADTVLTFSKLITSSIIVQKPNLFQQNQFLKVTLDIGVPGASSIGQFYFV